jgi:hypothetical protein
MTGLLAGPPKDATGLDAVRADLASVVQQLLGPARVSQWIRHCDRDWLTRDRRWRERSQTDRGFYRQPTQRPDVFGLDMALECTGSAREPGSSTVNRSGPSRS